MKTKKLLSILITGFFIIGIAIPMQAQETDESINIFKPTGAKETAKDFKPAPDKINTSYGTLEFVGGAFPTEESTQLIFDQLDLQRATQAYMDFMPAMSLYGIVRAQARDFGFTSSSDIAVEADFMQASENYLTGNNSTVYAFASLDLGVDGPTVVEIPVGMYGNANDADFKYLTDFGPTGPDLGKGGKYLFVPADYKGDILSEGYFVIKSNSYRIWAMMRGFDVGNGDKAVKWFEDGLKVYPLKRVQEKATILMFQEWEQTPYSLKMHRLLKC